MSSTGRPGGTAIRPVDAERRPVAGRRLAMSRSREPADSQWPEEDWARSTPYVQVPRAELQRIVAEPWGGDRLRDVQRLRGGKSNTNLRLVSEAGASLVLRIYERDRGALARERSVLRFVRGVVPAPRMLGCGALQDGAPYALLEWIEGRTVREALREDGTRARALGCAVGRALGAFGALELEAPGLLDDHLGYARRFGSTPDSLLDFVDWSLSRGRAGARLGPRLAARLRGFAAEQAPRLAACDARTNLVHGDYKGSNLLVARVGGGWRVAAVLDWEFARAGTSLFDLARFVRHRAALPAELTEGAIEAYREAGGHLPSDALELARILDLMSLCGILNAGGDRPVAFEAARRLIEDTVRGRSAR
jgi:aminoglycoside phosphotransferase (APT) family kinase protein